MQVPFGATYSDVDDLGPHLIRFAQSAYAGCCVNEHNTSKTKALKQVCKAMPICTAYSLLAVYLLLATKVLSRQYSRGKLLAICCD